MCVALSALWVCRREKKCGVSSTAVTAVLLQLLPLLLFMALQHGSDLHQSAETYPKCNAGRQMHIPHEAVLMLCTATPMYDRNSQNVRVFYVKRLQRQQYLKLDNWLHSRFEYTLLGAKLQQMLLGSAVLTHITRSYIPGIAFLLHVEHERC